YNQGAIRIRDVAYEEDLPEKFLELILLEMKNARIVESVRGAKGGYQLRRPPGEIRLSEIIRLIDGPLAPFGDAEQLRSLIDRDAEHRALYHVFLDARDAAANILEHTSLADSVGAFPNITHAQPMIGKANGWFEKAMGPNVKIQWTSFNAGPSAIEALFAGAIDMTYVGPNPAITGYVRSQGEALRVVAGTASGGPSLIVRSDSGIHSHEDFH